jgi:hypothetical protein
MKEFWSKLPFTGRLLFIALVIVGMYQGSQA